MATTPHQTTSPAPRRAVIQVVKRKRAWLPYLWLTLAILLLPFALVRWTIPLTAWLYPIFLLRFGRTQPAARGSSVVFLASGLVLVFALQGVMPAPGLVYYLNAFGIGLIVTLPYLIDRMLAPRLQGVLATLVFPSAVTTLWYLFALLQPAGTFVNPAYTQYGNLPLLQLLSVTGIWGIVFVMSWLASLVNWAWECGFAWPKLRGGAALYGSILALILLLGGARLALFPPSARTVRVAGITPSQGVIAALDRQLSRDPAQPWNQLSPLQQRLLSGQSTPADRALFRQASTPVFDELFARSEQEARAGAKIIVWPECRVAQADDVLQEDQAALIARASVLARTTGTYLFLNMCVLLQQPVGSSFARDQITMIDPNGSVVWHYQKAHPVPGEPEPPGDGQVPVLQTPYGRLSNVICFDMDFLDTIHQTGQTGADVLLVPGGDWPEIDPMHTQMAPFRAIENGYSLVRQADMGQSMAVDYQGRVLAAADYFTTDPQVMVADVPVQGVRTIYTIIGDLFAWLCGAGLVVLSGLALARRRKAGEANATESSGAPLPVSLPIRESGRRIP
jgi:apolipoprotein N-acyltransferase